MAATTQERVLSVRHMTDNLFSFRTTRSPTFRFEAGQFTMLGLPGEGGERPLLRAYSMASASFDEHLDFFSIKVEGGPLTSRLKKLKEGDEILIGTRATGTLTIGNLLPGKNLWLLSSGTGLAPFLSIVQEPDTYERFEKVIVVHSVRTVAELAYSDYLETEIRAHEFLGELTREKLCYFPTVTRESFRNEGRIGAHLETGRIEKEFGLEPFDASHDRVMLCGSVPMIEDLGAYLEARGFTHGNSGEKGHYLTERAFAPERT